MNKEKLKILFVSQYFYPENFKGNDLVFDLVQRGHEVTVLTGIPNYPEGFFYKGYSLFNRRVEIINGARVIRVPIYPRKNGKGINIILNYLSFIFSAYIASLFYIKGKFDIILVQQLSPITSALPGIWYKKRKGGRLYLWVLDLWPESFVALSGTSNKLLIRFVTRIVDYVYLHTDVFLVSSKYFIRSINSRTQKINEIYWFPNWAEENQKPYNYDSELPKFPDGFNIVFAGNIGDSQGLSHVLKACKITKEVNWIFVGSGRYLESMKSQAVENKLTNIYFFGRFPSETMEYFYKNADVMLVSLATDPVFGMTVPAKIQSYMSMGKSIIGILDGEGNELINDLEIGYAVKAGDWEGLAYKVMEFYSLDKGEIQKFEINSFANYQKYFNKNKTISFIERLFLEDLSKNK